MNDQDIVSNFIRNVGNYQNKQDYSHKKLQGFGIITKTFEDHYKNNCACEVKKGKNHWYKLCDCQNTQKQ